MNLKIIFRGLIKNRLLSLLSILVLTFGMSSFMLILVFIQYELSYDGSWTESEQIYRIILEKSMPNGSITTTATNYGGLYRVIADEIPGIDYATGLQRDIVTAYTPDRFIKDANFFYCDTSFFKVFDRQFLAGDKENPFPTIQSAVISESAALALYGRNDPVNQRFKLNEGWEFIVSGVFSDIPENSHLKIDIMITRKSLSYFVNNFDNKTSKLRTESVVKPVETSPSARRLWDNPNVYTYIHLRKNVDTTMVTRAFSKIYEKYTAHLIAAGQKSKFILQPIQSIHLDSHVNGELSQNSERKTITILYVIAILAMVMSWIIFMNFQIVQSTERAKETGMRKVVGASASDLLMQTIMQSLIIHIICILLTSGVFIMLRGTLSNYLEIYSHVPVKPGFMLQVVLIFILGSIICSVYPAYILSSKSIRTLLSEKFIQNNEGFNLRRSLVVFQFAASIGLMITTFVIIRQVWFLKYKDVGINISQTAYSFTPMSLIKKEGANKKLVSFMEEICNIPGVVSSAVSSCVAGQEINFHSNTIYPPGKPEMVGDNFGILTIDHHFQDVFEPKLLAGQMFTLDDKPGGTKLVINREACKKLGFDSPEKAIDQYVLVRVNDYLSIPETPYLVSGVLEDFHQESPRKKIEPMLFIKDYHWKYEVGFIALRFKTSGRDQQVLAQVKQKWESFFPDDPFAFQYTGDTYWLQLKTEEKLAGLSLIYTSLSIVLAALGLYGLAANYARKRIKEIGIRKINGARVFEIMVLLNRDILKWIAIAFLIASPVAWYAMQRWLENFPYKMGLSWWLLPLVGLLAMVIALLTVSWQSWRAASMNPVEALRYE